MPLCLADRCRWFLYKHEQTEDFFNRNVCRRRQKANKTPYTFHHFLIHLKTTSTPLSFFKASQRCQKRHVLTPVLPPSFSFRFPPRSVLFSRMTQPYTTVGAMRFLCVRVEGREGRELLWFLSPWLLITKNKRNVSTFFPQHLSSHIFSRLLVWWEIKCSGIRWNTKKRWK